MCFDKVYLLLVGLTRPVWSVPNAAPYVMAYWSTLILGSDTNESFHYFSNLLNFFPAPELARLSLGGSEQI